ncbi:MAG: dockerin type I repeat-containing protein [Oscillospiraceae bacterium]|nr:dockerin type I repeat-containing protein [Oscillospiraceae bacterium]
MNKMMKKIAAALLAAACIPVTGLTAGADVVSEWGVADWTSFRDMEPVNDRGMFSDLEYPDAKVFVHTMSEQDHEIVLASARPNEIVFVVREDADLSEVAEVIDSHLPGILDGYKPEECYKEDMYVYECDKAKLFNYWFWGSHAFWLYMREEPENKAALEAEILLDLAQKHLISAYYGFGQTAYFGKWYLQPGEYYDNLEDTVQEKRYIEDINDPLSSLPAGKDIDWNSVQTYLDTHHPGYTVEAYESAPYTVYVDDGSTSQKTDTLYRIVGTEELSFVEKLEVMCELWEQFGIRKLMIRPCEGDEMAYGQNALERPGDVTLDTDISIVDVIALNRNIMTGDPLCDTAKQNADINGDGSPDETDSLNLLKYIVGINETLEDA